MRSFKIGRRVIHEAGPAYVIAEIGHNHGGSCNTALRMIEEAKACGCDAVKFQKRDNKNIFTKEMYCGKYASRHAYGPTYGAHREELELDEHDYRRIGTHCRELGIDFLCTAFDEASCDLLVSVGVKAIKISSGDLTNTPLIYHAAKSGLPLIVSTGGADLSAVFRADMILQNTEAAFLHCVAMYPTPAEECNLLAVQTMRDVLPERLVGYSCHYNGIVMAEMAYVLGARIIEKHFTLDHSAKGSDHALSLQPDGMRRLTRDLRRMREAWGDGVKGRCKEEETALSKMEKCLYVRRPLAAGWRLTSLDVKALAPTTPEGLRPWRLDDVIGQTLVFDASTEQPLTENMIGGEE